MEATVKHPKPETLNASAKYNELGDDVHFDTTSWESPSQRLGEVLRNERFQTLIQIPSVGAWGHPVRPSETKALGMDTTRVCTVGLTKPETWRALVMLTLTKKSSSVGGVPTVE